MCTCECVFVCVYVCVRVRVRADLHECVCVLCACASVGNLALGGQGGLLSLDVGPAQVVCMVLAGRC